MCKAGDTHLAGDFSPEFVPGFLLWRSEGVFAPARGSK
jgi:hypothetical protein